MKVTLKEYAAIVGVNYNSIRSYAHRGMLPILEKTSSHTFVDSNTPLPLVQTSGKAGYVQKYGKQTRLSNIYRQIKSRCYNKNNPRYTTYGGRGITLCDEWKSIDNFVEWSLSHGYKDGLTIDRIDNDRGYSPDNCQWITRSENSKKRIEDHKSCCIS